MADSVTRVVNASPALPVACLQCGRDVDYPTMAGVCDPCYLDNLDANEQKEESEADDWARRWDERYHPPADSVF
jgi:hypothetical protein